jgi:NhaP-type Na+/H+ or K+/H+ antiporter
VDVPTLLLVVLILVFVFGGVSFPRTDDGGHAVNAMLYVIAVVLVVRLLGVLL